MLGLDLQKMASDILATPPYQMVGRLTGDKQPGAFTEAVEVTGVVLTKTDGSAKGGIVLAVREELGVPVRFVGVGEGADDLRPFEAAAFADRLLSG